MEATSSRWVRHFFGPAAGLVVAVSFVIFISLAAHSTSGSSTLWVAESRGVLALNQADGGAQFELPVSGNPRSVAADAQHATLWVFSDQELRSYTLTGTLKTTTSLTPPKGNPAILAVDPQAGRVWLGVQNQIYLFDGQGALLKQFQLPQSVTDIALDRRKSVLWVAYKGTLLQYDQQGNQVMQVDAPDLKVIRALDYDAKLNQMWVAADDSLRRYSSDGALAFSAQNGWFTDVGFIAADQQGGLWIASARQLANISSAGAFNHALTPYSGSNLDYISDLIADAKDHSAWVTSQRRIAHFAIDGTQIADFLPNLPDGKTRNIVQLALEVAPIAPQIQFTSPAAGSYLNIPRPTLAVSYSGDDIDLASLRFQANGNAIATSCNTQANAATCTPSQPLSDGAYIVTATIANAAGNASQPAELQLTIDTVAPVISVTSPANGLLTNQRSLTILGRISETASLTVKGDPVGLQNLQFSYATTLVEGANSFQIRATDPAGNIGAATLGVVLDTTPPPAPAAGLIEAKPSGNQASVIGKPGCVEGGSRVTIVNTNTGDRITVTANADGSFSATLPGGSGDSIQVYATDAATNQGSSTSITVASGGPFSGPMRFGTISPASGMTIDGDWVLVSIDLQAPPNTGVTVNGIIAVPVSRSSGLRYYAVAPLVRGQNEISIVARTQDGRSATQSLSVSSVGPFPYRILVEHASGMAPLSVRFRIVDQLGLGISQIWVDYDNDGTTDLTAGDASASIATTYSGSGLRQARFVVFDESGTGHVQVAPIVLLDAPAIDQSIQAVWTGMNSALVSGDKLGALQFMSDQAQQQYELVFDALLPKMPQIISSYSTPKSSSLSPSFAEYGVNRMLDGVNRIFLIDFVTNEFGQWQIDSM